MSVITAVTVTPVPVKNAFARVQNPRCGLFALVVKDPEYAIREGRPRRGADTGSRESVAAPARAALVAGHSRVTVLLIRDRARHLAAVGDPA